jgi:5-methylcytosine-specific restriction endonuclease McrA
VAAVKLRRAQDLLRHAVPNGDPAVIFDRALTLLLTQLERSKTGATDRPRTGPRTSPRAKAASRHVPAATQRVVWQRDDGRCAFTGPQGRCPATAFLEYHHVVPFAAGGETTAKNLELRCRAHNQYDAEQYFGPLHVPLVREDRAVFGVIANSFLAWNELDRLEALRIEEGSLYPALHRMNEEGWVQSEWGISDNNRRARFYKITTKGRRHLTQLERDWARHVAAVKRVIRHA